MIRADFRREYGIGDRELAKLDVDEFSTYLRGLSADALWREMTRTEPVELEGQEEVSRALSQL